MPGNGDLIIDRSRIIASLFYFNGICSCIITIIIICLYIERAMYEKQRWYTKYVSSDGYGSHSASDDKLKNGNSGWWCVSKK